jgi:hypothetical protein
MEIAAKTMIRRSPAGEENKLFIFPLLTRFLITLS